MREHPNVARVRKLFRAFERGDVETVRQIIPEEVTWHFPGRTGKIAGIHRGRDAVFGFLMNVQALTGGTFRAELLDVVADDRTAVALFRGRAERQGKILDNPTCLVIEMNEAGQVAVVREFVWDLYHVDDFWD